MSTTPENSAAAAEKASITTSNKRHSSSTNDGIDESIEDKNTDYLCPICSKMIDEAYATRCGHTFCYKCITKAVDDIGVCPECSCPLGQRDIFPNFLINEIISKYKTGIKSFSDAVCVHNDRRHSESFDAPISVSDDLWDPILLQSANLTNRELDSIITTLTERKLLLEAESRQVEPENEKELQKT